VDRLDRLTQRLVEDLDRRTQLPSDRCLEPGLLEQFARGASGPVDRERAEAHLADCLACLDRFVELRDHLQGIAAPGPVSPRLARTLDTLVGRAPWERLWTRIVETLRRALVFRVPAWTVAAMAALMLITWVAAYKTQRPDTAIQWPVDFSSPGKLTPTRGQVPRTVSGVVSSLRDATSNGVQAHVVGLKDTAGATYILFAWGQPTVRLGDSVEVDGIFASDVTQSAGLPVYQGVATQLRRVR
jgi:hypothetical protein